MDKEMELLLEDVVTANSVAGRHELDKLMLQEILKLQANMIDDLQKRVEILERGKNDN